jgi:hypothetical protein
VPASCARASRHGRPHAASSGDDLVRLVVDGEPSLMQALVDVGAEVTFELVQMGGALAS